MRVRELIGALEGLIGVDADNAEVYAFDADSGNYKSVSGLVYNRDGGGFGTVRLETHSDAEENLADYHEKIGA